MRTIFVTVALMFASTVAHADVQGVYDVKFEEVSTNCANPLRYPAGKLTVKLVANSITVDLDRTPLMGGIPSKNETINAKSKVGNTMVDGMQGVFSVAGKVNPDGLIHLVMVGEYSVKGKPLCSQSWNVSGPRVDNIKPKKSSSPRASVHHGEDSSVVAYFVNLARIGR